MSHTRLDAIDNLEKGRGNNCERYALAGIGYAILALAEAITELQPKQVAGISELWLDGEPVDARHWAGGKSRPYSDLRAELVEKGVLDE